MNLGKNLFALIVILLAVGIFVALYFYTDVFKREETVIPVAGIISAEGKIISVSPENNSFVVEMNLPTRHENGVPFYEIFQRTVIVTDSAKTYNPGGIISHTVFFTEAGVGDSVYISGYDILSGTTVEPTVLIIDADQIEQEE
ncbi:MAG: hypothetical protein HY445_02570 [Candidatus Niyogibacteria bacterium]|nr:hypothetical protein [Candidatus Niyogibacteria bacterium]